MFGIRQSRKNKNCKSLSRRWTPVLEHLEDRMVPATHIWQGPVSGGLWSTPANWLGGVPTSGEAGGTIVQFNGGIDSTQDIAGLVINQLNFTAAGNIIRNGTLGIDGSVLTNDILSTGNNDLDFTLSLSLSGANCFVLASGGLLNIGSTVSGNQGFTLRPGTTGSLQLGGSNGYTGFNDIEAGTLIATNDGSLGTGSFTEVEAGATLFVANITTNEDLRINGGTVTTNSSLTPTLSGPIGLLVGVTSTFDVPNSANMTLSGVISNNGVGNGNLRKTGVGTLSMTGAASNTYTGATFINDGVLQLSKTGGAIALTGSFGSQVGDGVGATASAILRETVSNNIDDGYALTTVPDGRFEQAAGVTDTFNFMQVQAGSSVAGSGAGSITLTNTLLITGLGGNDVLSINSFGPFEAVFNGQGVASIVTPSTVYDGQGGNDTLIGTNAGLTYNITGANAGNVSGTNLTFQNVENLTGGTGNDNFVMSPAGSVTGVLDGGAGTDTLDYSAFNTSVGVNLGANASMSGDLNGDAEVPPNASTASGTLTASYNTTTRQITVSGTINGLFNPIVDFHIHRNPIGVSGPVIVPIGAGVFVPTGTPGQFTVNTVLNLPAQHEAAFLGGFTYFNIHTTVFPGGELRGQIFATAPFVASTGNSTNTGGNSNIENAIGGSAADSLVGNSGVNVLTGNAGNDAIIGAQGNDTMGGGDDDDLISWSNGDNNDVIDGNLGSDTVQVNGSFGGNDIFTVNPNGSRVDFDRTNLVPFSLDIGTTETMRLAGIGGDDTMSVSDLTGVIDLTNLSNFGIGANDTFNIIPTAVAGLNYNYDGGPGLNGAGNNFAAFDLAGVLTPVYTPTSPTGGVASFGNRNPINLRNIQNITTSNGQFAVTVNGTAGNDIFNVFRNGPNLSLTLNGTPVFTNLAPSAISSLNLNGLDGNDQLIVDHSFGIVSTPINFDGGNPVFPVVGGDSLLVQGNFGGNFVNLIYTVTGVGTGSVNLDGNVISFTSLEPVTVTSLVGTTTINENSGVGHVIDLQDNVGAGLNEVIFDGGLESLTFTNPTVALILNANAGNDLITLRALDAAFAAPTININAGADEDTVQILATRAGTTTTVDTQLGTPVDRTIVGNIFVNFNTATGSLAPILGPVVVTDSGLVGQLFVDDSSNAVPTVGSMTGTNITIDGHTINYQPGITEVQIALGNSPAILGDTFLINGTSATTTVFGNDGGEVIDIQGSAVLAPLTINGNNGNDSFNLLSPSNQVITINGGPPVFGDPGVPPGDKITVSFPGVTSTGLPDGSLIIPGFANVNYTSIETLLLPDRFEFNNTIATATFLGSPPFVTLDRLNIHSVDNPLTPANEADIDYFRYTAHDTGYLVINAFFFENPLAVGDDLILEVRDANDVILAQMNFNDVNGERMVIPVVGQRVYYIRVAGTDPILDANTYHLEIENFAAPVPSVVDLTFATDTGRSNTDNITNLSTPTFNIQADLSVVAAEFATTFAQSPQLAARGLGILTPAQALAGNVIGFAVQVFIDGLPVGFADVVPGTDNALFTFTPTVPIADGPHNVTAAVRVFDVNTVPVQARSPLGSPNLLVVIDTVLPASPSLFLNPPDDTGLNNQQTTFTDNITSNQAANFTGNAEAGDWVQLFALDRFSIPQFIGTAQSNGFGQYFIDPNIDLNNITFFDLDGTRTLIAVSTDVAGNASVETRLNIFLDTRGPQVIGVLANGVDILAPKGIPGIAINSIDIFFIDEPARTDEFLYPAVNEILATTLGNYSLVGKKTGVHPVLSIDYVDATVSGDIGQTMVRLNFGGFLPDDQYTLKVFDRVADVAFNKLDGDFFGALPSGDGVPGGNFVTGTGGAGSINLDNTPELGFYANGSVNIDINGDFIVNPSPVAGQDVVVPYGPTGSAVFVGQFSDVGAGAVSGFDRLGTYGKEGKKYYFRLDFNDDSDMSDPGEKILSGLQINGLPIAGNWNFDKVGDEVGLFTGTAWYLDTDGDNSITAFDTKLVGKMRGLPIAGDFDGDGQDDLATYQKGTFFFDLADNGLTGNADTWFKPKGFPGGANGVASKLARPVTSDFDRDGIDDVGLFIPNQTNLTKYQANWFFLVSNDAFGFNRIFGTVNTLDHSFKSNQFPSGSLDFSASYGSSKALPVVGNFDPPTRPASSYQPADIANLAHNLADLYFASTIDPFTGQPKKWRN